MATITSYDAATAGNVVNQVEYAYNGYQLVSEVFQEHDGAVDGSTKSVVYNYDDGASGGNAKFVRLASVEYPGTREVFYIYPGSGIGDVLNRVEAIADDSAGTTRFAEYEYLGAGTIVAVKHPEVNGGLTLDYNTTGDYEGWDTFGRVVSQEWTNAAGTTTLDHYTYSYDYNSNRTSRHNELHSALDEDYTYDGMNRLVDTDRNGSAYQSWDLDSLGNWSSFDDDGTVTDREHNEANELTTISGSTIDPTYDAAGNMISGPRPDSPTDRQHYVYDAWNRMVEALDDDNGTPDNTLITFEYDGRNYRIQKTGRGVAQAFFYNEGHQLLETQSAGSTAEEYIWDLRYIDAPVLRETRGGILYYTNDANMNVTGLVDEDTGNVVERYHYDPYGKALYLDGSWTALMTQESAYDNFYLYTGRRLDVETALMYYRARYYDVSLGQFVGRDPLQYIDGANLYRAYFVPNGLDPTGLRVLKNKQYLGYRSAPDGYGIKEKVIPEQERWGRQYTHAFSVDYTVAHVQATTEGYDITVAMSVAGGKSGVGGNLSRTYRYSKTEGKQISQGQTTTFSASYHISAKKVLFNVWESEWRVYKLEGFWDDSSIQCDEGDQQIGPIRKVRLNAGFWCLTTYCGEPDTLRRSAQSKPLQIWDYPDGQRSYKLIKNFDDLTGPTTDLNRLRRLVSTDWDRTLVEYRPNFIR